MRPTDQTGAIERGSEAEALSGPESKREMTESTIVSLRGYTVAEMLDHLRCLDGLSGLVAIAFTDDGDDRIGCEVFVSDMTVERLAYAGAQLARTIGEEI